ncbi:hypothetical protein Deipe_3958 (plasmid) [Deinococcus peraridilitoris DSM 19664]|uniref:Uncharacterized protein n=1 Tax=Deinococcus peraridilitoris (strain DSM 19664 / LMG 22246 / CIP 109416 / KR-200) TaxID=937777 RepID=L0A850_DEIPD|nr:hypothetical protein Deipe_3958 [Deinococcus peraridilitoris DSM 19664]
MTSSGTSNSTPGVRALTITDKPAAYTSLETPPKVAFLS